MGQRGALWWSSIHRRHHREGGSQSDPHGAKAVGGGKLGVLYSQIGWVIDRQHFSIDFKVVEDWWQSYPELLLIEAFSMVISIYFRFWLLAKVRRAVVIFGVCFSLQFEGLVNSYCHTGEHTGEHTTCDSIDSPVAALLTGGEGFHYGHHKNPLCACHGWRWGALKYLDVVYDAICVLECFGLVWDVRHPTAQMISEDSKHAIEAKTGSKAD